MEAVVDTDPGDAQCSGVAILVFLFGISENLTPEHKQSRV